MNSIDLLIILFLVGSLMRGWRIGLLRQAGSTLGFLVGLFLGSWVGNAIIAHENGSLNKSLTSLLVILLCSFSLMTIGEIIGVRLKHKLRSYQSFSKFDDGLGSLMGAATMLLAVWLAGAILVLGPVNGLQQTLKSSRILSTLNTHLPPATQILGSLNKLINPNGFPEVFSGLEPSPSHTTIPDLGALTPVVQRAEPSVVKVEGTGCGGIVEGSGFVVAPNEIATDAHVVAGVSSPKVVDDNGIHDAQVMWFDPDVDLALLKVDGKLAGKPLRVNDAEQASNTPGVVLGYPGGGDFDAQAAAIIDHFTAYGRNIYGQGHTVRDIYSVKAKIIPGNSGGPLIGKNGDVLGIVFATSTTYNDVGYALTGHQVAGELAQAEQSTTVRGTGQCSD